MLVTSLLPVGFGAFFIIVVLFFIVFLLKSVYLVRQAETVIIERLGKYHRLLTPGLHFIIPFIDQARQSVWSYVREVDGRRYYRFTRIITRVDLRESVYDFPKQNVITKDNVIMEINALLYYQITSPTSAVYEVLNLPEAIEKLTQTTLRNVIGSMDLDETLVSRDQINERLRVILDEATDKWGVKVNRVELQEVKPPEDIRAAMEKEMRAERDRRATMLTAEGTKHALILNAEGIKEAEVLTATGEAKAKVIRAKAEAEAIDLIKRQIPDQDPLPYLIATQYIRTLPELMKSNDKLVLMPFEASGVVSSLAAIKTIFDKK